MGYVDGRVQNWKNNQSGTGGGEGGHINHISLVETLPACARGVSQNAMHTSAPALPSILALTLCGIEYDFVQNTASTGTVQYNGISSVSR